MSDIQEFLTVLCPFDQIEEAMQTYLATLVIDDGKALVALRAPFGDMVVERSAELTLTHSHAIPGYEIMTIAWVPHDGGLFPRFDGKLCIEDMGGNYCRLDLNGSYLPPLGVAGKMFDSVIGHRLAVDAARELLDEIRIGVELAFMTGMHVA